ncbi:putative protocadherin beta-18 [Argonauta hians]
MTMILIVRVFLVLTLLYQAISIDLIYHIKETTNPITYVGDVEADIQAENGFVANKRKLIWFSQLLQRGNDNSHLFNVTETGKLYASQPLDAENLCEYDKECSRIIVIAARFKQSFIKIFEIKVIITDVNDHSPEFSMDHTVVVFSEGDGRGIVKHIPNAIDKDVGVLNSRINYKLIKHERDPFELTVAENVDSTSTLGIKLKERIDREKNDSYLIQLIAEDCGLPSKKSRLEILVNIEDINDNVPKFSQNVYNITVLYKHRWNKPIATLSAIDYDSGDNGKISYHFSTKTSTINKSFFQLNDKTGDIFLKDNFNANLNSSCKIFIKAKDQGNPPLSSIALVMINIINQQNKAPKIDINFISKEKEEKIYISEAVEIGSYIAFVKVTDDDVGKNGQVYCHLRSNKFELESLGSNKYKVVVKERIDRETELYVNFTIICRDHGSPSLQTNQSVIIELKDVNDVIPYFPKEKFQFSVHENQNPNFPIGLVSANDLDIGPGGQLSYSLNANKEQTLPFEISSFGFISTTDVLDREKHGEYYFQIVVKDNGIPPLSNQVNATVTVLDQNDNRPYFIFPSHPNFLMDVHFFSWGSRNITVLRAADDDININAFLNYEILTGNQKRLFHLDKYSGVLSFTRQLFHTDSGLYRLEISVKDSGSPVLSALTTLSLKVTVSNSTATASFMNMFLQQEPHGVRIYLVVIVISVTLALSISIVVITALCIRWTNQEDKQKSPSYQKKKNHTSSSPFLKDIKQHKDLSSSQMFPYNSSRSRISNDLYSQELNSMQESCNEHSLVYNWQDSNSKIHSELVKDRKQKKFFDDMVIIYDGPRLHSTVKPEVLGNYNDLSERSSYDHTEHDWIEAEANHYEELLDIYAFPAKHQQRNTSSKITEDQNIIYNDISDRMVNGTGCSSSSNNSNCNRSPPLTLTNRSIFHSKPLPEIPQKMFSPTSYDV